MAQAIKIMILRHAEKPGHYGDKSCEGVRFNGDRDRDSLVPLGWQRAGALCTLFGSDRAAAARGLAVPEHLYASDPERVNDTGSRSRRPKETISVLSRLLGVPTSVEFAKGQEVALAAAAVAAGGTVLISWSHENIPSIAREIPGGDIPQTRSWPDDRYDAIWVFDLGADGRYTFRQVWQALLPGDRPADS